MHRRISLLSVAAFFGALVAACTDNGSETVKGACKQIVEACHPKDDGSDETISGCHTLAHDNEGNDAACSGQLQMCLDVCNAAPPVGGHDETGGHETGSHEDTGSHDETGGHETGSHEDTGSHDTGGHDDTDGHDGGHESDTEGSVCDEIASACHGSETPTGMMCHEVGHDGDAPACAEVARMCLEECA